MGINEESAFKADLRSTAVVRVDLDSFNLGSKITRLAGLLEGC